MNAETICLDFSRIEKKRVREKVKPLSSKSTITFVIGVLLMKNGIWDLLFEFGYATCIFDFISWIQNLNYNTGQIHNESTSNGASNSGWNILYNFFNNASMSLDERILKKESNGCRWIKINRKWRRKKVKGNFPMRWSSIWSVRFFWHFANTTKNYEVIPRFIYFSLKQSLFLWTLKNLRIQPKIKCY